MNKSISKWITFAVAIVISILAIATLNFTNQSIANEDFVELEFLPKFSDEYNTIYAYELVVHNQTTNYAAHITETNEPGIAIDKLLFIFRTGAQVSRPEGSRPGIFTTLITPSGLSVTGFYEIESISTMNFLDGDAKLINRYLEKIPENRVRLSFGESYDINLLDISETRLLVIEKPD